jgi:hypothetical protein
MLALLRRRFDAMMAILTDFRDVSTIFIDDSYSLITYSLVGLEIEGELGIVSPGRSLVSIDSNEAVLKQS